MGQHLELTFLGDGGIEQDKLREVLAKVGVTGKKWNRHLTGGGYGWLTWSNQGQPVGLFGGNYDGIWGKHFVRLGFDAAVLQGIASLDGRKRLVDEFLKLGVEIWTAFSFYEGDLSPEETGRFLHSLRQSTTDEIRRGLPVNSFARFLNAEAANLVQPHQWVRQAHPYSTIKSLGRESLMVIWDATSEGLARFLSEEFSIT